MPTVRPMKAKVVLLGDGGVGKTSLIRRFVVDEHSDAYLQTVGTKVTKVELTVPFGAAVEVQMEMSLFDIMGQRGFKDMVRETYYHGAHGLMAVADLTRKESLYDLNDWIPSALEVSGDVPVYLVINKKDLEAQRDLTDDEIRTFAESFGATHAYVSARTGAHVEDAFNAVAIEIVDRTFRREQARAEERGLRDKLLVLLEKRGTIGLRKAQFFQILKGVGFDELQVELRRLEGEGLLTLMWYGASDFTAVITPRGAKSMIRPPAWDEE